jgi:hypothetical protein
VPLHTIFINSKPSQQAKATKSPLYPIQHFQPIPTASTHKFLTVCFLNPLGLPPAEPSPHLITTTILLHRELQALAITTNSHPSPWPEINHPHIPKSPKSIHGLSCKPSINLIN